MDGASSADVTQGRLGNCWFVAAAASIAEEKNLWSKVNIDHFNNYNCSTIIRLVLVLLVRDI